MLVTSSFGGLADGSQATAHTIGSGADGLQLTVLDLGATVTRLRMPLPRSGFVDVALGLGTAQEYASPTNPYLGATVGRYANRIGGASFTLDGVRHELAANEGATCLHGGPGGFHSRRWSVVGSDDHSVELELVSPDGDQGFPGEVTARVRYTVGPDTVTIEHHARTDAPTVVSLTNHTYFNLAGEGTVEDHRLTVAADAFLPVDADSIPLGTLEPVQGGPFDFREAAGIHDRVRSPHPQVRLASGIDHAYVVERRRAAPRRPSRAPADRARARGLDDPAVGAGVHGQQARRHPDRPGRAAAGAPGRHRPGVPGVPGRPEPPGLPVDGAAAG